jgi:tetratricopeptide (TPR) repeat protein
LNKGAAVALKEYTTNRSQHPDQYIGEGSVNSIGYVLLRMKKVEEAIALFIQNTVDFPKSGNTWDSLAEAYMTNGNKEQAIKYYEQAVQLDPGNTNAVEQIKKMKK